MLWTRAEEGTWINWTKDAEDKAARRDGKEEDRREG